MTIRPDFVVKGDFAAWLYRLRKRKRHLTQQQLAVAAGISVSAVVKMEAGRVDPSLTMLLKLAEALDVKIGYFAYGFAKKKKKGKRREG